MTFYVIMNDVPLVFSLVSLIYRKATKFCILIVYPTTLHKAFMSAKISLMESLGLYLHTRILDNSLSDL